MHTEAYSALAKGAMYLGMYGGAFVLALHFLAAWLGNRKG